MIPSSLRGEYVSTGSPPLIFVAGGNYFVLIDLGYNYNVQCIAILQGLWSNRNRNYDLQGVSGKYYINTTPFFSLGLHVFNNFSPHGII